MNATERLTRHAEMVELLAKPGIEIIQQATGGEGHLLHMALGVCGEAGELGDAIKKHVIYKKRLDRANVVEELGDLVFYMQGIMNEVGIGWDEVLDHTYDKLMKKRYPNGYSNEAAIARADKTTDQILTELNDEVNAAAAD